VTGRRTIVRNWAESSIFARKRYKEWRVETMEVQFRNREIDLFGEFDSGGFNLFGHWYPNQYLGFRGSSAKISNEAPVIRKYR
jgi:hypothetical protein